MSYSFILSIGYHEIKAQCTCGPYMGIHCGYRIKEGLLKGSCNNDTIYYCAAANIPAQEKTTCNFCYRGEKLGLDICSPLQVERGI
jgi:hypothetical protein